MIPVCAMTKQEYDEWKKSHPDQGNVDDVQEEKNEEYDNDTDPGEEDHCDVDNSGGVDSVE